MNLSVVGPGRRRRAGLEVIGEIQAKGPSLAWDQVLHMEVGGGISILPVKEVIHAGGGIQVLEEIVAEEGEVNDPKTCRIHALCRERLPGAGSNK